MSEGLFSPDDVELEEDEPKARNAMRGFRMTNHPHQIAARGGEVDDDTDTRITPDEIFAPLHRHHRFTIDVAASAANARVPRFFDRAANGLARSWRDEVAWANPPFSGLQDWVRKAFHEVREGGCLKVVLLLPANRTEQPWWHDYVEPYRDQPDGFCRTKFIPRRRSFGTSGNPTGKYAGSPPFGIVLVTYEAVVSFDDAPKGPDRVLPGQEPLFGKEK